MMIGMNQLFQKGGNRELEKEAIWLQRETMCHQAQTVTYLKGGVESLGLYLGGRSGKQQIKKKVLFLKRSMR